MTALRFALALTLLALALLFVIYAALPAAMAPSIASLFGGAS